MKKKLLFAAAMLLAAVGVNAQTDVTSTYLTNADFSQSTPLTDDYLYGYGKDGTPYGLQAIEGWTSVVTAGDNSNASYPNSGMAGGVFAYGSTTQLKGGGKAAPTTNPDGEATGNCLGFFGVWSCGGYYYQEVTFPAGKYTITVPMYNQNGTQPNTTYTGFFPTSGTNKTVAVNPTAGSWVNQTVTFTLSEETAGQIRIGYQSTGSGSGANPMLFIDCVKIEFTAQVIKDVLENALTAANNANATLNSSDLAAAITTAQAVYDDENATQEEVNNAAATLNAAVELAMSDAGDVSFLIPNLGFEDCTAITTNAAAGGSASPLDIEGKWKQTSSASWSSSAVVEYGGEGQVNGVSAPSADNAGNTGKTLGVSVGWGGTVTYLSASATLPAGVYTVKVNAYNALEGVTQFQSKFGFVPTSGTSQLSSKTSFTYGEWETDEVNFTLNEATEGAIQVGGTAISGGSGSNAKVFFDNITIGYKSFLAGAKEAYDKAVADAEAAKTNCAIVTGKELTALNEELDKAEPTTIDGYNAAAEAINAATQAFVNAAPAYNAYAVEKVIAEKIGVEVTEEPTTAAEAAAAVNDLKVAEFNFVNEQYPYDYAPVIGEFGTWTGTATVDNQPATPNYLDYEHWSGETHAYYEQASNGWGNPNGWTIQYEKKAKLPAGDYMLKVAARSSAGTTSSVSCSATDFTVSLPTAGNTAKGIDKSGAANFGEGDFVHDGAGFGWEWRFLPFTLTEETEVTMIFYAEAKTQYQWMSISDGTLLSKQEIVNPIIIASTDDAAPEATVASEVTTDRKLLSGLNTIVLPFETTATEIGATTVLEYTGTTTSDAGNIVFNFKEVAPVDNVVTLQANVPYAVFVDADQTEALSFGKKNIAPAEDLTTEDSNGQFDFVGTYTNLAKGNSVIVAGDYIAGETAFKKVANGGNRVAAYRAYLKKVGSSEVVSEVAFNFGDTFVDGIEAVEILNKLSGNIYNLNGQKLNNVQKGINIVNGKKLFVK